jgi:predicted dehydrogenase
MGAEMFKKNLLAVAVAMMLGACARTNQHVGLMTLDPGHFHAALVQKFMYPQVDPVVHVYAPAGDDLQQHLKRINGFNSRTNPPPTHWVEAVYTGPDFAEKMFAQKPGSVVVLAGNNAKKTDYILRSVQAGLNVLADKPMVITPAEFPRLKEAFAEANKRGVLVYDIMTERSEITSQIERELAHTPEIYGHQQQGTLEQPAIVEESVHYFLKEIAGSPLRRPAWFFDTKQQGEGIVDVSTHLVDLVQWLAFPDQVLDPADANVLTARRWPTAFTTAQFARVTGETSFPDYLKPDVDANGVLQVFANGGFDYTLRGVHARINAVWDYSSPAGKDTHHSLMRGSRATLEIRQTEKEKWRPTLYVADTSNDPAFGSKLQTVIAAMQTKWPGVAVHNDGVEYVIDIPLKYDIGHEAHFAQVTERFLKFLAAGKLPAWEEAGMMTKYATTMRAYELSRPR